MSPDTRPTFQQEEVMHIAEYQPQAVLVGSQAEALPVVEAAVKSEPEAPLYKDSDFAQSFYVLR